MNEQNSATGVLSPALSGEKQAVPLSLYSAAIALEDIGSEVSEAAALIYMLSQADDLDEYVHKALRSAATLLDALAAKTDRESEAYLAGHVASRAVAG